MASDLGHRRWGAPVLLVMLLVAIGVFGVPSRYSPVISATLTLVQLVVIGAAALSLFLPAWRSGDEDRRGIALAGLLLIIPWALLTLMPGFGPPFAATLAMNHERFVILFISTMFLGLGLWSLKDPLARGEAGDRLAAPMGQVTALFAVCIQLVWAAILVGWTMTEAHKPKTYLPFDGAPMANASDVLLFFAGLLTYASTAFYALSFACRGWLGKRTATVMVVIAAVAIVGLITRGLQYPDLPDNWYTMPGMIVGIPAIPWVMPYVLGVVALVRASHPTDAVLKK